MEFKEAQLYYINPLYALYIWLRVRVMVSNVWYGIKSVLDKIPIKYRKQLLNEEEK